MKSKTPKAKTKAVKTTKTKTLAGKPKLQALGKKTPKPQKKSNFLKVLATTIAIGVASALLIRKDKPKAKKSKTKTQDAK